MTKTTFLRYENKYYLSADQYSKICRLLEPYTLPDEHCRNGGYFICDRYYDTAEHAFAVDAKLKHVYREKIRVRCYEKCGVDAAGQLFLEQKMKLGGLGHKRRVEMGVSEAESLMRGSTAPEEAQPINEMSYTFLRYQLLPSADISYYRTALTAVDDPGIRITMDTDISARDMRAGCSYSLLSDDYIMEIKIPKSLPIWLVDILEQVGARPCSFSKYGKFIDASGYLTAAERNNIYA